MKWKKFQIVLIGSCEKMKIWINNLWKYIYNQDEKKHMQ